MDEKEESPWKSHRKKWEELLYLYRKNGFRDYQALNDLLEARDLILNTREARISTTERNPNLSYYLDILIDEEKLSLYNHAFMLLERKYKQRLKDRINEE